MSNKLIQCSKCGDEIENGYAINPENSAICNICYDEEAEEYCRLLREFGQEEAKIKIELWKKK